MTPETWRRIEELYHAALELPADQRSSYLIEACPDEGVRGEVEELLRAHSNVENFLAEPAMDVAARTAAQTLNKPHIGEQISHYRVVGLLGAGGMGEVYRARDVRLDRSVAIKVLSKHVAADPQMRMRFEREAKVISQLNHPHICALYDIGHDRGIDYIVMELVEGETLAERIRRQPLTVQEALTFFDQMADALEAAHAKGIVHRDLKPANVKLTSAGKVKVLDFGLAKAMTNNANDDPSERPTVSFEGTQGGVILGTVAYMSPEQARGMAVDHRTDIWAFGCCLYEALTGKAAYAADTVSDTIAAILDREPNWGVLPKKTPLALRRLLRRCLQKEIADRPRTAAQLRLEIEECRKALPGIAVLIGSLNYRRLSQVALAVLLLAAALAAYRALDSQPSPLRLENPVQVSAAIGLEDYPTLSPDGRTVAYESNATGNWDIWIRQPGGGPAVNFTADYAGEDRYPSWSPDGRQIAFWSARDDGGYYVMSSLGGAPRRVASTAGTHSLFHSPAEWSADGTELAVARYQPSGPRLVASVEFVSIQSGDTRQAPLPGSQESRLDLSWSRDGRFLAYVDAATQPSETTQLVVVRLSDGFSVTLTDGRSNARSPRWSPDGGFLYYVSNQAGTTDLWRRAMGSDGKPGGPPQRMTTAADMMHVAFTLDGKRLAYSKGRWVANLWRVPIFKDRAATWDDAEQMTFDQAFIEFAEISPDGRQLTFSSDRSGNQDVWTMPIGGEMIQLTSDPAPDWFPRRSPDGRWIGFYSYRTGDREIWVMPAAGGPARQLTRSAGLDAGAHWSPDSKELAFRSERTGSSDIWVIAVDSGETRNLTPTPWSETIAVWSPDQQWVAFTVSRPEGPQIWRVPSRGGEQERLSPGPGGGILFWSFDAKQIFFVGLGSREGNLWALSLDDRREFPMTNLTGRRGALQRTTLSSDGKYLYFTWRDDLGDVWTMDIIEE